MPDAYINAEGNGVTTEFLNYARPLLGGLPEYERLQCPKVPKA
jgi:6-phosphofructokinase 1